MTNIKQLQHLFQKSLGIQFLVFYSFTSLIIPIQYKIKPQSF